MATSPRNHVVPAALETPRRQAINDLAASINDFVVVTNVTDRAQKASDLSPSTTRPLVVWRQDARAGFELEVTTNGSTWRSVNQVSRDLTNQGLVQAGSFVGSVAANGTLNLTYPTAFTTIVNSLVVSAGASTSTLGFVRVTNFTGSLTGEQVQCYQPSGAVVASGSVRINWMAFGY